MSELSSTERWHEIYTENEIECLLDNYHQNNYQLRKSLRWTMNILSQLQMCGRGIKGYEESFMAVARVLEGNAPHIQIDIGFNEEGSV